MKKIITSIIALCAIFANFQVNADSVSKKNESKISIGVGYDVSYMSPLIEASYKIYENIECRLGLQYTFPNNMKNVYAEDKLTKEFKEYEEYADKYLNRWKYTNFAIPFTVDFYFLGDKIRTSVGMGYMLRKFKEKLSNQIRENANKVFFIAGIGYKDTFSELSNLGFSIDIKCNILNTKLKNTKKNDWIVVPTAVFSLLYNI